MEKINKIGDVVFSTQVYVVLVSDYGYDLQNKFTDSIEGHYDKLSKAINDAMLHTEELIHLIMREQEDDNTEPTDTEGTIH